MPNEAKTDDLSAAELAGYIDHTLLKPDATTAAVDRLCAEARQYEFAAVCVNSCHVARVAARLGESPVKICSVVGFPLGAMASSAKACEAKQAVADGAHEIDMVLNVGLLKSGDDPMVLADIRAVREAAPAPAELKVIIETCLLSDAEKNGPAGSAGMRGPILSKPAPVSAGAVPLLKTWPSCARWSAPHWASKPAGGSRTTPMPWP